MTPASHHVLHRVHLTTLLFTLPCDVLYENNGLKCLTVCLAVLKDSCAPVTGLCATGRPIIGRYQAVQSGESQPLHAT